MTDTKNLSPHNILKKNFLTNYLKVMVKDFKFRKVDHVFTCPKCQNELPSALFITGTIKLLCQSCKFSGDIVSVVRLLEKDQIRKTDSEIALYLKDKYNVMIPELDLDFYLSTYEKFGFDLVACKKNDKEPFGKGWTTTRSKGRVEWEQWINSGFNVGIKTGKEYNISVIDVDGEIPEILKDVVTMIQKTNKGYHYVFQYDEDIPNNRIEHLKIDLLGNGKQFIAYPSKINGIQREWNFKHNDFVIPKMPDNIKKFIMENSKPSVKPVSVVNDVADNTLPQAGTADVKVVVEGSRNNTLIQYGGILRKKLNEDQTKYVLSILNKNFFNPPLSEKEYQIIVGSLGKYIASDEHSLASKILEYLSYAEEGTSRDIREALQEKKIDIDKALAFLVKERYVLKRRSVYKKSKKMIWRTDYPQLCGNVEFKTPYFSDIAEFTASDQIIIGSPTGHGKTTIAMNMVKRFVDQGITPHLVVLETGSRFIKTGAQLGLSEGQYKYVVEFDPSRIIPEENSVTIIDWLCIEDFATTQNILQYFSEQSVSKNCFMIIFMQLKEDGSWFAPNLVKNFSALAARYLYEPDADGNVDGLTGYWQVDKIRESKTHMKSGKIPCRYFPQEKLLLRLDEIKNIEESNANDFFEVKTGD